MRCAELWLLVFLCAASCSGNATPGGSSGGGSGASAAQHERIRAKVEQVRTRMQALRETGQAPAEIYAEMKRVQPLIQAGRADEAEAVVDRALVTLAGDTPRPSPAPEPAPAPAPRPPSGEVGRGMLGMIPSSPDGNPKLIPSAFEASRRLGADVLYWYFSWADAAGSSGPARVIPALRSGGRVALTLSVIRTTVQGRFPKPWKSFDEPGFAEAFAAFAAEFAAQHRPDYLFVGNEANTYLHEHPEMVPAYEEIVRRTVEAVHRAAPGVRVGVVISFRDAERHDAWPMVRRLVAPADLVGYTVYGYEDPDFQFPDPSAGLAWLERLPNGIPGKPYAVLETGWNTAANLGSSEAEQAEFARLFFRHLAATRAEFVTWFLFQDGEDCTKVAGAFLKPGLRPKRERFEIFKSFLCNFGLRRNDGTPKAAWQVFEQNR
jgi:hypothetical protein